MANGQRDIIVGGGISPAAPATQYSIPMWDDNIGGSLTDSILREVLVAGGNVTHIVVGVTDPPTVAAGVIETFRTQGGIISTFPGAPGSVVIGEGASISGSAHARGAIAIGHNASANNGGSNDSSIVIGNQASDSDADTSIVIGSRAFASGGAMVVIGHAAVGQGGSGLVIGNSANAGNSAGMFVVGHAAQTQAANGMALGNNTIAGLALGDTGAMAVGSGAVCQGGHSMAIGFNSSILQNGTNAENMAVGPNTTVQNGNTNAIVIGPSSTAQHSNCIVLGDRLNSDFSRQFKVGFGHNGGIADLPIYGVFIGGTDQYGGYEGITYRHVNGLGADNSVGPLQFISPLGTGNGNSPVGGLTQGIEFFTAAVPVGSGSAVQTQALNFKVLSQSAVLTNTDAPIALPNYFDGAGAALGTLTNAPRAGDPTHWIPINAKGTIVWLPAWSL